MQIQEKYTLIRSSKGLILLLGLLSLYSASLLNCRNTPAPEESTQEEIIQIDKPNPKLGETVVFSVPAWSRASDWDSSALSWTVSQDQTDISSDIEQHDDGTMSLKITNKIKEIPANADKTLSIKAQYKDQSETKIMVIKALSLKITMLEVDTTNDTVRMAIDYNSLSSYICENTVGKDYHTLFVQYVDDTKDTISIFDVPNACSVIPSYQVLEPDKTTIVNYSGGITGYVRHPEAQEYLLNLEFEDEDISDTDTFTLGFLTDNSSQDKIIVAITIKGDKAVKAGDKAYFSFYSTSLEDYTYVFDANTKIHVSRE